MRLRQRWIFGAAHFAVDFERWGNECVGGGCEIFRGDIARDSGGDCELWGGGRVGASRRRLAGTAFIQFAQLESAEAEKLLKGQQPSPQAFGAFVRNDIARLTAVIRQNGIRID